MRIKRQAVLLIHGIGEQRPMETLRAFVYGAFPEAQVFSKPDRISGSFELRKLSVRSKARIRTECFEFYWADKISGTRIRHLVYWFKELLFRLPWRMPPHLRVLWGLTWLLVVSVGVWIAPFVVQTPGLLNTDLRWVAVAVSAVVALIQAILIGYLGDAARYLSPRPENVGIRRDIRQAGVDLLKKLHEEGRYDRIVVVGHSLGSVIAYDILSAFWGEAYMSFIDPPRHRHDALDALEEALLSGDPDVEEVRRRQRAVWTELRAQGHAWLVSDLVTLGSPLAHAEVLVARDRDDFVQRTRDRELPTNPPQLDFDRTLSFVVDPPITNTKGEKVSPRAPHHAAPFSCVRWTNVFYPAAWGLFGDIVGGRLAPLFGAGVKDVPLPATTPVDRTLLSHTRYWGKVTGKRSYRVPAPPSVINALDLDWSQDRPLPQVPPSPPPLPSPHPSGNPS